MLPRKRYLQKNREWCPEGDGAERSGRLWLGRPVPVVPSGDWPCGLGLVICKQRRDSASKGCVDQGGEQQWRGQGDGKVLAPSEGVSSEGDVSTGILVRPSPAVTAMCL